MLTRRITLSSSAQSIRIISRRLDTIIRRYSSVEKDKVKELEKDEQVKESEDEKDKAKEPEDISQQEIPKFKLHIEDANQTLTEDQVKEVKKRFKIKKSYEYSHDDFEGGGDKSPLKIERGEYKEDQKPTTKEREMAMLAEITEMAKYDKEDKPFPNWMIYLYTTAMLLLTGLFVAGFINNKIEESRTGVKTEINLVTRAKNQQMREQEQEYLKRVEMNNKEIDNKVKN
ncbi:DNA-directed RNA polymerase subunit beta [Acrasis kona]|uniref:DNA-directed RNA polymerase subunit beta n=1 Tax=Acrasis kona TaxID=1008807 RepID=A0AAW2ZBH7_9EUKA